jgi:hypothetical protein
MPQLALLHQSADYNYICPFSSSQLYSCCRQAELCSRESQPSCCGRCPESCRCCPWYIFINDTSTVELFDSRASRYFISATYVEKHNLPLALLKCEMIVSSPRGDMPIRQLCLKVNLEIRGIDFVANLIALESKGTDVILAMD